MLDNHAALQLKVRDSVNCFGPRHYDGVMSGASAWDGSILAGFMVMVCNQLPAIGD